MDANEPAFPGTGEWGSDGVYRLEAPAGMNGLTKRELFAAMAMQGIAASYPQWVQPQDAARLAECAVASADALLAELAKEQS